MFAILEKMLAFILEAMKDTPQDETHGISTCDRAIRQSNKKLISLSGMAILIVFGLSYTWYEYQAKGTAEIHKLKSLQSEKIIEDLQRANRSLKEERIRLAAKLSSTTDKLTVKISEFNQLVMDAAKGREDLSEVQAMLLKRNELITIQKHKLEKLHMRLSNAAKDNRIIWDEIVTLGNEGG